MLFSLYYCSLSTNYCSLSTYLLRWECDCWVPSSDDFWEDRDWICVEYEDMLYAFSLNYCSLSTNYCSSSTFEKIEIEYALNMRTWVNNDNFEIEYELNMRTCALYDDFREYLPGRNSRIANVTDVQVLQVGRHEDANAQNVSTIYSTITIIQITVP